VNLPIGGIPAGQRQVVDHQQVLSIVLLRRLGETEGAGDPSTETPRIIRQTDSAKRLKTPAKTG
jgi:hypothetical protein